VGSWNGQAAAAAANGTIGFQQYHPPAGTPGENTAEEPSIGHNHATDTTMYQSGLHTFAVKFDDTVQPAAATWTDVSSPITSQTSLDPILFTDAEKGRTWVSQLTGADSLSAYTDDDGAHYTPSQGGGIPSGPDHQTIGAGPYNPNGIPPQSTVFGHAVFYCSQGAAAAFCARSDNGGITYGAGIPVYSFDQCGGLHGHIRVAPNGLDMLPNQNCDSQVDPGAGAQQQANGTTFPHQAVVTSNDNGNTWTVQTIPGSHATLRSDPSVAADNANKVYFGYEDAVKATPDAGTQTAGKAMIVTATIGSGGALTWGTPVDVGAPLGIQNVQFPEVITGDSGRAAYAFLGSTTAGDPEDTAFAGIWHLYVAITTDGGTSWKVVDTTPTDPVQRGCMYLAGNDTCPSSKRNLLDFMDITVDEDGHTIVGYADGCTGACATLSSPCTSDVSNRPQVCNTGTAASTARYASIARLQCGPSLYVEYDNKYGCAPVQVPEVPLTAGLAVAAAAAVAVPAIVRRRQGRGVLV
jgi:hypothetical protein